MTPVLEMLFSKKCLSDYVSSVLILDSDHLNSRVCVCVCVCVWGQQDACCGLSAYELQRLKNIGEREAFFSSLMLLQVSGHVDWNSNQHKIDRLVSLPPPPPPPPLSLSYHTLSVSPYSLFSVSLPLSVSDYLPMSPSSLCLSVLPFLSSPRSSPSRSVSLSLCLPHTSHI